MLVWLALLLALLLIVWLLLWTPRALPGIAPKPTLLLGHRGVRLGPEHKLPENSLAAFRAALDAGLDGVETDLQRSRDGQIVLYHDYTLPDGRAVGTLTCEDLQKADPHIPTLEDLFVLARAYPGTLLNLELKTRGWRTGGLERAAAEAVRHSGLEATRVLVSSFNPLSLRAAPPLRARASRRAARQPGRSPLAPHGPRRSRFFHARPTPRRAAPAL